MVHASSVLPLLAVAKRQTGGSMTTLHRRRNPVAQAAILRKGGVHEKSRKSKRQKQKRELRNIVSKAMATYRGHSFICFLTKCLAK